MPAAYSRPDSKPLQTDSVPEDMLAAVAAEFVPEQEVSVVPAKQRCMDTVVSNEHSLSHAQQPPASGTADESTEAHRRHLLAQAASRAADKAASVQRAADARFKKAGKSKAKVSKPTPTFDQKAVWKGKGPGTRGCQQGRA